MQLTKNFTLEEMCYSDTARAKHIDNLTTNRVVVDNLKELCVKVLQPVRDKFGAVRVSSGYRCSRLNTAIGGVKTSQHMKGQAADIDKIGNATLRQVFDYIKNNLDFDQLLFETNSKGVKWIHVSYVSKGNNRHQVIDDYRVK